MITLVTGSNGFLGTSLVKRILEKTDWKIRCLVRPGSQMAELYQVTMETPDRCQIVFGSLNNRSFCDEIISGVDTVFHLASAKSGAPAEMFQGSSVATKYLLESIVRSGNIINFVHCSSFSVYGVAGLKRNAVIDEETPLEIAPHKRDTYAYSKWHQEKLVRLFCTTNKIPFVILRPGVVYGPRGTAITPRVGLNLFGYFMFIGGSNRLPLTYVQNCADAFIDVAKLSSFKGDAYNVVDDNVINAKEFLTMYRNEVERIKYITVPYCLMQLLSICCEKYFVRSNGQLPEIFTRYKTASIWKSQTFSNKKLKSIGWTPEISTIDGLNAHMTALRHRPT